MSREAIECFVDEIRDEVPKIRRLLAIIHACPEDRESQFEAHRLAHSLKGTALLVNIPTLSAIALKQELLIEHLIDGRLSMDDRLRDSLERLTDHFETYGDGLLLGNVPEQRLQDEATELFERHVPSEPDKLLQIEAESPQEEPPLAASHEDEALFLQTTVKHLEEMAHKLDQFRRDLTRWDLLADVRRRMNSLKSAANNCGLREFAHLAHHVEDLVQRLLDRTVPPTESAVDCLQACVDALEQHLEDALDESILLLLHERLDEICGGSPTQLMQPDSAEEDVANAPLDSLVPQETQASEATPAPQLSDEETGTLTPNGTDFTNPKRERGRASEALFSSPLADASGYLLEVSAIGAPPPCSPSEESLPVQFVLPSNGEPRRPDNVTSVQRTSTDPKLIQLDDHATLSEEMMEVFTEEAEDHLRKIYAAFTGLESRPAQMSLIQDVRRSAHTIKGAAGSVGLWQVSKLSHRMEDLLEGLFESQQAVTSSTLALLFDTTDTLQDLVHGNYVPAEMQVAVAQLYDSYDIILNPQAVNVSAGSDSVTNVSTTTENLTVESSLSDEVILQTPIENLPGRVQALQNSELAGLDVVEERRSLPPILNSAVPDLSLDTTRQAARLTSLTVETAPATFTATEIVPAQKIIAAEVVTESRDESAVPVPEIVIADVLPLIAAWGRLPEPASAPVKEDSAAAGKKQTETLRVPLDRIDSLVREVGELIINRTSFAQRMADFAHCVEEIRRAVERLRGTSKTLDVKYGVGALGGRRRLWGDGASSFPGGMQRRGRHDEEFDALELDRYSEFHLLSRSLAETTTDIGTIGQELQNLMGDFDQLLNRQGRLSRGTQDRLMRIRMVPLAVLTTRLHRTVRVVAGQQDKLVDFLIQGGETEFDKLALEDLADPLMHILRNAVDHGIESTEVRLKHGKPLRATIRVQASYQGPQAVICIQDDGCGLDLDAIRETAIRNGLVSPADVANFTEDELTAFIFLPGFSTARELSEVSGRGVGMDIVRDKVLKLKGSVSVESQPGQGTTFIIRLPMTLAMTRALLVQASNETFAIPIRSVAKILRFDRTDIEYVDESPVIRVGETTLPLVYLSDRLRLRQPPDQTLATLPILVVASGDEKVAVVVDKILPGRDIVVKTLGTHLRRVRGLIGATLMGDGSVIPILDAADLVGHAGTVIRPIRPIPESPVEVRHEQPVIMVVDDSVSVRRVMMNLLKKAGWIVIEAKDGLDAIEQLHQAPHKPDLILLDVEMPRMDGYELLGSLRSQDEYRETPIVMVTSRSGDKHRNKAMQLGATDYIVKPYQDDQLLSLIRRLLMREPALV